MVLLERGTCKSHEDALVVAARLVVAQELELLGVDGAAALAAHKLDRLELGHAAQHERERHKERRAAQARHAVHRDRRPFVVRRAPLPREHAVDQLHPLVDDVVRRRRPVRILQWLFGCMRSCEMKRGKKGENDNGKREGRCRQS